MRDLPKIDDLPHLSDWFKVELVTLWQAAALWGGIEPTRYPRWDDVETAERAGVIHSASAAKMRVTAQALLGAIATGSIKPYMLRGCDYNGNVYPIPQNGVDAIDPGGVSLNDTVLQMSVLINWARRAKFRTLKQDIQLAEREQVERQFSEYVAAQDAQRLAPPSPERLQLVGPTIERIYRAVETYPVYLLANPAYTQRSHMNGHAGDVLKEKADSRIAIIAGQIIKDQVEHNPSYCSTNLPTVTTDT